MTWSVTTESNSGTRESGSGPGTGSEQSEATESGADSGVRVESTPPPSSSRETREATIGVAGAPPDSGSRSATDCTTLGVATDRSSVDSPAAGSTGTGSTGTDGMDCTATGSTDARSSTMAGSGERDESGVLASVTRLLQAQTEALATQTKATAAQHLPPLKPGKADRR